MEITILQKGITCKWWLVRYLLGWLDSLIIFLKPLMDAYKIRVCFGQHGYNSHLTGCRKYRVNIPQWHSYKLKLLKARLWNYNRFTPAWLRSESRLVALKYIYGVIYARNLGNYHVGNPRKLSALEVPVCLGTYWKSHCRSLALGSSWNQLHWTIAQWVWKQVIYLWNSSFSLSFSCIGEHRGLSVHCHRWAAQLHG